jgi:hypothetical protein
MPRNLNYIKLLRKRQQHTKGNSTTDFEFKSKKGKKDKTALKTTKKPTWIALANNDQ